MYEFFIDFLKESFGWKVPAVFFYYSSRMILALLTSLLFTVFFGPRFIKKLYEWKIGQSIRMEECPHLGKLHAKKQNTPTMGGILMIAAMLVSLVLWMDWKHPFTLVLFSTTLFLGGVGAYDDYLKLKYRNAKGLSKKAKFGAQVGFSLLIACYLFLPQATESIHMGGWYEPPVVKEQVGSEVKQLEFSEFASRIYFPFLKEPLFSFAGIGIIFGFFFAIFVITGASNAVNLTDGLDGLAAGCLGLVATCLALIAFVSNHLDLSGYLNILYIEGSGEIAIFLTAFIGACLGFLWYNGYPAQVFMGDTGSLALGGIIGVSALLLKREILLALVGGIFVAEALSVILQVISFRLFNKRRIFLCAPLHHHFEYKGWPETKVVIRFWIIGIILALVGIASLKFQ